MNYPAPSLEKRIGAMGLDYLIVTIAATILFLPGFFINMMRMIPDDEGIPDFNMFGNSIYIGLIGFAFVFAKDAIRGRSVAKRVLGLQVIRQSDGTIASPLRCFVRNLTAFIWPVEAILTFVQPGRRLGDLLAGTAVVPFDPTEHQGTTRWGKAILSLVLAYGIMLLMISPILALTQWGSNRPQLKPDMTTYNEELSQAFEATLIPLFEDYFEAEVRYYDQMEIIPDHSYVSITAKMHYDLMSDEDEMDVLHNRLKSHLMEYYGGTALMARVKYTYRTRGTRKWETRSIQDLSQLPKVE